MMKNLLHKAKRLLQKTSLKFIRISNPPQEKAEYERDALNICRKLIQKSDTLLLLTPISNKRYIKNDKSGIFVILEGHNVKVINHVYSYTVFLGEKSWNKITNVFDLEVESRREEFEREITSNIRHSLQTIYKQI
jgi:hypothetical protein